MSNKKKGTMDPWRRVEPLRPPVCTTEQRDRSDRIDLEDLDFDADLVIPGSYVIRSKYASFAVTSVQIEAPKDALEALARCIVDVQAHKGSEVNVALRDANIGAMCRTGVGWNIPGENITASTIKADKTTIWFVEHSLNEGLRLLAQILRMPDAADSCKKYGVVVMLNA